MLRQPQSAKQCKVTPTTHHPPPTAVITILRSAHTLVVTLTTGRGEGAGVAEGVVTTAPMTPSNCKSNRMVDPVAVPQCTSTASTLRPTCREPSATTNGAALRARPVEEARVVLVICGGGRGVGGQELLLLVAGMTACHPWVLLCVHAFIRVGSGMRVRGRVRAHTRAGVPSGERMGCSGVDGPAFACSQQPAASE
jgi:hypothetical protein